LHNPLEKKEMERKTLAVGRMMTWDKVAGSYIQLFSKIIEEGRMDNVEAVSFRYSAVSVIENPEELQVNREQTGI